MKCKMLFTLVKSVLHIFIAYLMIVLCSGGVFAKDDLLRINQEFPSEDELKELPRYCWARMKIAGGKDPNEFEPPIRAEILRWREIIGATFTHLHHYCGGINRVRRYWLSVNRDGRDEGELGELIGRQRLTLENALAEFKYVKGYMRDYKCILYPDLLVNEATAHWQLGDRQKAVSELLSAVKEKSDYAPPYLLLSQILEEEGNVQEAERILELGLEKTHGASSLKARLDKLKGK